MGTWRQTTRTVPTVFVAVGDPVGGGFADSLARPGGNATGFMDYEWSLSAKWLELLKQNRAQREAGGGASRYHHRIWRQPICRHPGRGAVTRRGGQPGQRKQRRRDRARRCSLRTRSEWRPDRGRELARCGFIAT
jgi:hypothetical protein